MNYNVIEGLDGMGRILIGISSWADEALVKGGFYPEDVKTPEDRLRHYALNFPLAEVDSSYHFLPTGRNISGWIEWTPRGFIFDVRVFSLFTQHPTSLGALPQAVRDRLENLSRDHVYISNLPDEVVDELWNRFIEAIQPLFRARKLGVVLFQFPPWFHPREENLDYIAKCRERLARY